jgi:inhibitor of cysteine peptidase
MMEDTVAAPVASLEKSASSVADTSNVAHSETNTQVFGVDEADTVKTDGKYLYTFQE